MELAIDVGSVASHIRDCKSGINYNLKLLSVQTSDIHFLGLAQKVNISYSTRNIDAMLHPININAAM
jgi:hypothetical protein